MKKLFGIALALILFIPILIYASGVSASIQIDKNISDIMQNVADMAQKAPEKAMSSNPYDYTINNANFDNIVNLGTEALPLIRDKINKSDENGLREYILAIAAEKIAKVDLKDDRFLWATGKDWVAIWDKHLQTIPQHVNDIVSSDAANDVKVSRLVKLGTPSIPYILDHIESGNIELAPALEKLLEGNPSVKFETKNITDLQGW
ncbi:MAG: hypothetical protein ABFD79_05880 [Phycisphaerales bacterium]